MDAMSWPNGKTAAAWTHAPRAVVERVADVEHGRLDLVDGRPVQDRVRLVHPQDQRVGRAWRVGVTDE
jgi:hypothetical protein